MTELVFNIRNIFNLDTQNGCLGQYEVNRFHIPAYQRGYKWASKNENDAIPILLSDLWEAFISSKNTQRKEYYMQYITVKKHSEGEYLEVIDGQQRLTSFSILLSVFNLLIENIENHAKDKLEYAIRDDFFKDHIYEKEKIKSFISERWDIDKGIRLNEKDVNTQDVFYLHSATVKIHDFLAIKKNEIDLGKFLEFILDYVMIIVNEVELHVDSERVFRNLNSNKIPLTESELVKGLLLTKAARGSVEQIKQKHFREILEIRSSLGRQWDEIVTWVNNEKVKNFFFYQNNNKPYSEKEFNSLLDKHEKLTEQKALLLLLLSMTFEKDSNVKDNKYLLFNYFHKQSKIISNSNNTLQNLKETFQIIRNYYQNNEIYNLIGYHFFSKGNEIDKLVFLDKHLHDKKDDIKTYLRKKRNEKFPENIENLNFNDNPKEIQNMLLALSVFRTGKNETIKFDFYSFAKYNWSLEHIFPQSPEGKGHVLTASEKEDVKTMIGNKMTDEILSILNQIERTENEKNLYYDLLKQCGVNSIGNMTLLTLPDNISNGCDMFWKKRTNVMELIQKGSFVPVHTFEAFNKIVIDSKQLTIWNKLDIENHTIYISSQIAKLKNSKL